MFDASKAKLFVNDSVLPRLIGFCTYTFTSTRGAYDGAPVTTEATVVYQTKDPMQFIQLCQTDVLFTIEISDDFKLEECKPYTTTASTIAGKMASEVTAKFMVGKEPKMPKPKPVHSTWLEEAEKIS